MLRVLVSPLLERLFKGISVCVLCDFNSNMQASRFVLTICLDRYEAMFPHVSQINPIFPIINNFCMEGHTKHLLGNARISSILIVAKESHESSTLSVYPCSQCIDMRRSTSCFIVNPNKKSQRNEICVLPCRPQLRTNIKSHIGEKPNKCN